jgi:low temperature requirement protein LtrA
VLIFIVGLALPQAYGREGALFAGAYTLVRLIHLAVYADASRRGAASWSAIVGFAVTVIVGMATRRSGAGRRRRLQLPAPGHRRRDHHLRRRGQARRPRRGVGADADHRTPGSLWGVAVYMLGLAAFRRRMSGELSVERIALAITLIVLFAVSGSVPAWAVAAGLAVLTIAPCAAEGFTARAAAD